MFIKAVMRIASVLVFFCLMGAAFGQSVEGWKLEKDKNGIKVYSRLQEGDEPKEIRVICNVPGTIPQLVAYLFDVDYYPRVIYRTKLAHLVRRVRDNEFIYYTEIESPWPVSNRDLVARMTFQQNPATKTLRVEARQVPGLIPPKPNVVRMPYWHAVWNVRPLNDKQLHIEYTFKAGLGGEIPAGVIDLVAKTGPYQSFLTLKESLSLSRYQGKTFSFLQP
ncbi:START domain-containing protein [Nibrella saemangeumensis]|uniref:START domain-containing protein n=2 Tax=Nibrella saemangeumensis TaxID=1084526 RepID=A0ABP8MMF8_9BACT